MKFEKLYVKIQTRLTTMFNFEEISGLFGQIGQIYWKNLIGQTTRLTLKIVWTMFEF